MTNIVPISDLKNYSEVLRNCDDGSTVYLTKNGRGNGPDFIQRVNFIAHSGDSFLDRLFPPLLYAKAFA